MIEIWGVGNKFRSDDSVALKICDKLKNKFSSNVKVNKYHGDILNLLNAWNLEADVYLIDAIKTGEPLGTVHFYKEDEIKPICETSTSTHGLGAAILIEMAKSLDLMPHQLYVCGVEAESFELGVDLSPSVEKGMDELIKRLSLEINKS